MAGMVAGVVGSVALRAWMTGSSYVHQRTTTPDQDGPAHKVGSLVAETLQGTPLTERGRYLAGEITHYAFGAITGGIYGGLAEVMPWTTAGYGALFGTGVFLAADESSMPLLKLVPPPWTETPAAQLEHWAAHLVFGVVSEAARRQMMAWRKG